MVPPLAMLDGRRLFAGQRLGTHPKGDTYKSKFLAGSVALLAAVAAGLFAIQSPLLAAERSDGSASVDMVVTVVKAKNMCFNDTLQVTGVITPREEILVRPDREGLRISEVLVGTGDAVVSGQVLARLTQSEKQQEAE